MARGCDRPSPSVDLPFAPEMDRCPSAIIPVLAVEWVSLYNRWRALGALPCPGGWDDQPGVVGEAFYVIAAATAEVEAERWRTSSTRFGATRTSTLS